jgi:hypothetical protein
MNYIKIYYRTIVKHIHIVVRILRHPRNVRLQPSAKPCKDLQSQGPQFRSIETAESAAEASTATATGWKEIVSFITHRIHVRYIC